MSNSGQVSLRTLLGDYPVTQALKKGEIRSNQVALDFADVKVLSSAFKQVVRELKFDVAELSIVTYLMAKAYGKPLVLLPAVLMGRFQHPYIVYNSERGVLTPRDLKGKRIAIRSYSVTTVTWIRGILANDYGLDLDSVKWVTFEEPHVAEYPDPATVTRAPAGKEMMTMLLEGEVDAAIVGDRASGDSRVRTLFPDPAAEAQAWRKRNQAIQINHMVVVRDSLTKSNPGAVREVYRMLQESRKAAGLPTGGDADMNPFGVEANRRNLEVAIDYVYTQKLIPRQFSVDELFDDVTRGLG